MKLKELMNVLRAEELEIYNQNGKKLFHQYCNNMGEFDIPKSLLDKDVIFTRTGYDYDTMMVNVEDK